MTARRGVVLSGTEGLSQAFGQALVTRAIFLDASATKGVEEAKGIQWLAAVGAVKVGAALVSGRIVTVLGVGSPVTPRGAESLGLLVRLRTHAEGVLLHGVEILAVGALEARGAVVRYQGEDVAVVSCERLESELEGLAWTLGHDLTREERTVG